LDVLRSKHRFRSRLNVDQEFLYRLEDEINRARYEINETYMGQADLRARFHLAAAMEKILSVTEPQPEKSKMSTIAEQLKAARAKLTEARDGAANAIAVSQDASKVVLGEVNKVLKEAEDLRAEVAELTNGGPE
jgi:hypothetical protein